MTSEKLREQVSAFLDGELSAEETALLLKRLATNPELLETASRFQLIKDTLNKHTPDCVDRNFSRRLHERLRFEAPHSGPAGGTQEPETAAQVVSGRWKKSLAGVALAASVAVVTVLGIRLLQVPESTVKGNNIAESRYQQHNRGTRWSVSEKEVSSRLNSLLVNHSEYTSSTGLKGLFNFVQVAGYDAE